MKRGLRQRYSDDLVLRLYDDTPCTTLLVSFCSLTEGDAAEHEWIGTAKRALMTHILCLCDPIRAWYLRGTTPTAPFTDAFAIVESEVERLAPSRVICIGSSMGGHAAARCGLRLGLSTSVAASVVVLAFGPQVFLDPYERVALRLPWMSFDDALDRLQRAASTSKGLGAFRLGSLVPMACSLAASEKGRACVRLELHVGAQAASDVREAALLEAAIAVARAEGAASERLSLHVHKHDTADERSGHCVAASLHATGFVEELLRSHRV